MQDMGVARQSEVDELRGRMAGVQRLAESDLTKSMALLANIVESLERYAGVFAGPLNEGEVAASAAKATSTEPPVT